jgi:hypothetical protein
VSALIKPDAVSPGVAVIQRVEKLVIRKARRIVQSALKGSEIDEASPKPEGWTEREYRIAQDARNPKRAAPYYLEMAQKVCESADRIEAARNEQPKQELNGCTIINVVAPQYPVKKIEK